jgi:hypothetical protein
MHYRYSESITIITAILDDWYSPKPSDTAEETILIHKSLLLEGVYFSFLVITDVRLCYEKPFQLSSNV